MAGLVVRGDSYTNLSKMSGEEEDESDEAAGTSPAAAKPKKLVNPRGTTSKFTEKQVNHRRKRKQKEAGLVPVDTAFQNEVNEFHSELEFDFSRFRSKKRSAYLRARRQSFKRQSDCMEYLEEEGLDQ